MPYRESAGIASGRQLGVRAAGHGMYFLIVGALYELSREGLFPPAPALFLISILCTAYAVVRIVALRRRHPELPWALHPTVLSSITVFIWGYGIGNLVHFLPEDTVLRYVSFFHFGPSPRAVEVAAMAAAAAPFLWWGYNSTIGQTFGRFVRFMLRFRAWRRRYDVRPAILGGLCLLALTLRLEAIRRGLFGYRADLGALYSNVELTQWLALGYLFGTFALIASLLWYLHAAPGTTRNVAFVIFLFQWAGETLFGFVNLMKGAVLMPSLLAGATYYFVRRCTPRASLAALVILLGISYAVVEPRRQALRGSDSASDGPAVASIEWVESTAIRLVSRLNYLDPSTAALDLAHSGLPPDTPEFARNVLFAPFYAVVPRLLWPSKPVADYGLWFTRAAYGSDGVSATGMGIIGNLYYVGGWLAVFVGFFFVGVLQRGLWQTWLVQRSGPIVLFLVMLPSASLFEIHWIDGWVVDMIRTPIIVFVMQALLFRR